MEAHVVQALKQHFLPEPYKVGLSIAQFPGRAQVVREPLESAEDCSDIFLNQRYNASTSRTLAFFLDGAHTPESMEICAKWFCRAVKDDAQLAAGLSNGSCVNRALSFSGLRRVLLFNCMQERDPQLLLPPLLDVCQQHGLHFHTALFVPGTSSYTLVQSRQSPAFAKDAQKAPDLIWQRTLQRTWCQLLRERRSAETNNFYPKVFDSGNSSALPPAESVLGMDPNDLKSKRSAECDTCAVMPSLPATLEWLRQCARRNPSLHLQVVVTGSLHLVGDVLKTLKR
eukprot:TRINITY_DN5872_c0_g2_i1.p1 TRINITY_DN5872_c0_g2~~TRINITY_DN5872_c0_g2_i1.p1  ORF type:complete len:284 (+),score=55.24 TRINITY_DN5872_c0_g2_i1:231-1082(+)